MLLGILESFVSVEKEGVLVKTELWFSVFSALGNPLSVITQPDNHNQLARWLTSLLASKTFVVVDVWFKA